MQSPDLHNRQGRSATKLTENYRKLKRDPRNLSRRASLIYQASQGLWVLAR
jgi:hypothetical protein